MGFPCKEKVLKAGTKLRGRLLFVGMHRAVEDPAALAAAHAVHTSKTGNAPMKIVLAPGKSTFTNLSIAGK